jgi:hypothetical protein
MTPRRTSENEFVDGLLDSALLRLDFSKGKSLANQIPIAMGD